MRVQYHAVFVLVIFYFILLERKSYGLTTNHVCRSDRVRDINKVFQAHSVGKTNTMLTANTEHVYVDGLSTSKCKRVQRTEDTFVSTGTVHMHGNKPKYSKRVLLLSHGRVQWFDLDTKKQTVILASHASRFRGMYMSNNGTYVFLITPKLRESSRFLEIDTDSNILRDVEAIGTLDGHDMVKYGDLVYVVSTGTGTLQVYHTETLALIRTHNIGTVRDHLNTVAVSSSSLYVMLHKKNTASSEIQVHYRFKPSLFKTYKDVGWSAHGISRWKEYIVSLDSFGTGARGSVVLIHRTSGTKTRVWTCPTRCFLKGLAVVNDEVVFGMSPPQKRIQRLTVNSQLVSITLKPSTPPRAEFNYIQPLQTSGLLNQIVHPHHTNPTKFNLLQLQCIRRKKTRRTNVFSRKPSFSMLGPVDITTLRQLILTHWTYIWSTFSYPPLFEERTANNARFFTTTRHARVLWSFENSIAKNAHRFMKTPRKDTSVILPAWLFFRNVTIPVLDAVFARLNQTDWESRILRIQLNHLPPNGSIRPHQDIGYYANNAHRIHIPLIVSKCIVFRQRVSDRWYEIPFKEGEAFEINNKLTHTVEQHGPYDRVTMIVDYLDRPCSTFGQLDASLLNGTISSSLNVQDWRGEDTIRY